MSAFHEIRLALETNATASISREHVRLLFARYEELLDGALALCICSDTDRTKDNVVSIVERFVEKAQKINADFPRREVGYEEQRRRELHRDALKWLEEGNIDGARAALELMGPRLT